ncbi:hypothetical protein RCL1_005319 [Eukaryota sp. TZLM3-RCL]
MISDEDVFEPPLKLARYECGYDSDPHAMTPLYDNINTFTVQSPPRFVPEHTIHLSSSVLGFILYRCMADSRLHPGFKSKNYVDLSAMLIFVARYGKISQNFRSIVLSSVSGWIRSNSCTLDLQKSFSKRAGFISQLDLKSTRAEVKIRISATQLLKFATIQKQLDVFSKVVAPEAVTSVSLVYSVTKNIAPPAVDKNSVFPFPNLESITLWSAVNVAPVFKILEVYCLPRLTSLTLRVSDKSILSIPNSISHITELNIIVTHNRAKIIIENLTGLRVFSLDCYNKSTELIGLEVLENLENLHVRGFPGPLILHSNVKLVNLKLEDILDSATFTAEQVKSLKSLVLTATGTSVCLLLSEMNSLEVLNIDIRSRDYNGKFYPKFVDFSLPYLPCLQYLEFKNFSIEEINFLNLPLLSTIIIPCCSKGAKPTTFLNLSEANYLTIFRVSFSYVYSKTEFILPIPVLSKLTVFSPTNHLQFLSIKSLPNLRSLLLYTSHSNLFDIEEFLSYKISFPKVTNLKLHSCPIPIKKFDWSLFPKLTSINFRFCQYPSEMWGINKCESVKEITLDAQFSYHSLGFLRSFPRVHRFITLGGNLSDLIDNLKYCRYVSYLEIVDYEWFSKWDLYNLSDFPRLKYLHYDFRLKDTHQRNVDQFRNLEARDWMIVRFSGIDLSKYPPSEDF